MEQTQLVTPGGGRADPRPTSGGSTSREGAGAGPAPAPVRVGAADAAPVSSSDVLVRRSRTDDLEVFEAFVAGLSVEASTRRFFTPTARMPRAHARLLIANDPTRGSFLGVQGDRVVAHGCWAEVAPGAAEMALVVTDATQRRGLGRRLARTLLQDMLDAGMRRMEMVVEPDNRAVVDLISRSWPGARPRLEDGLLTYVTPVTRAAVAERAVA